ncbi:hypothetical protein [Nonomuraea sp. NPDC050310]|uniref:hypothetical protein n=1 Tax=unclassified Nonomuraea TaxID=2593643 RepID=UPI0033C7DACB
MPYRPPSSPSRPTRSFLDDHATGPGPLLVIAHSANRWALQHLLNGIPLEDLVNAPFTWQPGWTFHFPPR